MRERGVMFPSGELRLEGILSLPEGQGPFATVVVCHPHPLYGGAMDNNVVIAVCQALSVESIATLRFNFRGVGGSDGFFGQGIGEQEDVRAALSFLSTLEGVDAGKIGLAGYSFGAGVALSAAPQEDSVQAVAGISPPLSSFGADLKGYCKPKLFLCGSGDTFIPAEELLHLVKETGEPKQCEIVPGADHFWWGYEEEAARKVASFFTKALK